MENVAIRRYPRGMSDDLPLIHLKDFEPVSTECLQSLPEGLVRRQLIIPISHQGGRLLAAVPRLEGIVKPEGLQLIAHCPVDLVLAPIDEIIAFIREHYDHLPSAPAPAAPPPVPVVTAPSGSDEEDLMESGRVREPEEEAEEEPPTSNPSPVPELTIIRPEFPAVEPPPEPVLPPKAVVVDDIPECPAPLRRLLSEAAANRAREILLEREGSRLRLRQRIRGVLVTDLREKLTPTECDEVFRYVTETGDAQAEGGVRWAEMQLETALQGQPFGCQFTLSETKAFAMLTIRLVPIHERAFDPVAWGMGPHQARTLDGFLARRQGMILFCGFEGDDVSGTTQSCLRQLVTPERHVIAVHGRRDERLPGVEQLVSFGDRDLFSRHLLVAFRHSPDVVLANPLERRDHFEMCLNEALRGRLILGGSHAADAADAVVQIFTMGVEPYLLGSALLGVVAQRTLRLNCQRCQDKDIVDRDHVKDLGIPTAIQPSAFFRGRGCDVCLGTGFDRETSIFEVLEFNEEVRTQIQRDLRAENIRALLRSNGMMTLRQIAVHKAINGQTSLSEVFRATA